MLYVSTIKDKSHIGVTDTDDNIEEFYSNSDLVHFYKDLKLMIYGCYVYNNVAELTELTINRQLEKSALLGLVNILKTANNPWNMYPLRDYMACLKVGTCFTIMFIDRTSSGITISNKAIFTKVGLDNWKFECNYHIDDGCICNSDYIADLVNIVTNGVVEYRYIGGRA